jgi:choice-of-anchor C domain-containing protein
MKFIIAAFTALGLTLAATAAQAASFLINGSFEDGTDPGSFTTLPGGSSDLTGWSVFGYGVDYVGSYWQAADGNRSLDLSALNAGGIQQNFKTWAGTEYKVSFDYAGNPGDNTVDPIKKLYYSVTSFGLLEENVVNFDTTNTSTSNMGWQTLSFSFIAKSSDTSLIFSSYTNSAYGPALDNVSVTAVSAPPAVPLPAALPLFAAGMAGLGAIGRIRSRRKLS